MSRLVLSAATLLTAAATSAQAHTGAGGADGFVHGLAHPIGGLDHMLAMVAVGLIAARLGGRARWLLPLSFLAMLVLGAFGLAGAGLPGVETGIGASVVLLGLAVAVGLPMPAGIAVALVGFFGIFHGIAHGSEMPEAAAAIQYGAGFVLATASLHLVGMGLHGVRGRVDAAFGGRALQMVGSAMALAGIAILAGSF